MLDSLSSIVVVQQCASNSIQQYFYCFALMSSASITHDRSSLPLLYCCTPTGGESHKGARGGEMSAVQRSVRAVAAAVLHTHLLSLQECHRVICHHLPPLRRDKRKESRHHTNFYCCTPILLCCCAATGAQRGGGHGTEGSLAEQQ